MKILRAIIHWLTHSECERCGDTCPVSDLSGGWCKACWSDCKRKARQELERRDLAERQQFLEDIKASVLAALKEQQNR